MIFSFLSSKTTRFWFVLSSYRAFFFFHIRFHLKNSGYIELILSFCFIRINVLENNFFPVLENVLRMFTIFVNYPRIGPQTVYMFFCVEKRSSCGSFLFLFLLFANGIFRCEIDYSLLVVNEVKLWLSSPIYNFYRSVLAL